MADVIPFGLKKHPHPDNRIEQIGVTEGGVPIFAEEALQTTLTKPECVWTCAICNCQCFQLLESGVTSCVRCGHRSDHAADDAATHWRAHLPDLPLNLEEVPPLTNVNVIIDQKPVDMILQGFVKGVKTEDPVAVFMIRRDGSMRMWCEGVYTDEQEDWFRQRLDRVCAYILERHEEPT